MLIDTIKLARVGIATLSATVMLAASWLFVIEFLRPRIDFRLNDAEAVQTLPTYRGISGIVARVGLIRGRLWTEHALTFAPFSINKGGTSLPHESTALLERARKAAVRAVHSAPLDSRAWLVIAQVDSAVQDRDPAPALKMSYYVGPNEESMFPLRIAIATRSSALVDPELHSLLGDEIQRILETRPAFKPYIVAAYRDATSEGKRFIEQEVGRSDRDLLSALRANRTP
jgi:hypothetical protein